MHILDSESNLLLRSSSTWTYEIQLKIRRWFRFTSLPVLASSRIPQLRGTASPLLVRCTIVLTASAQNCLAIQHVSACSCHALVLSCSCALPPHSDEGFSELSSLYGFPDSRKTLRICNHSIHPHCRTSST